MNIKNTKAKYSNQKGQTLLFVIVAVTIAMAVGVAVSTRTIQSLKRVARTDTSARVIAAAEGGIENLLSRNYSQLNEAAYSDDGGRVNCAAIGAVEGPEIGTCSYIFSSTPTEPVDIPSECACTCKSCKSSDDKCLPAADAGKCGVGMKTCADIVSCDKLSEKNCLEKGGTFTDCPVKIPDEKETNIGDLISSRAVVKVEKFSTNEENEENDGYSFNLVPGSVKEVNLEGYSSSEIKICWENAQSAIYYLSYNKDGDVLKGGLKPVDDFQFDYISDKFVWEGVSTEGSYLCKTVSLVRDDRYGLRIKVLYNDSKVAVFPIGVDLPFQGYKFTSRGEISTGAGVVDEDTGEISTGSGSEEKATVIVYKSLPYASDIFDYGIYTPTTLSGYQQP